MATIPMGVNYRVIIMFQTAIPDVMKTSCFGFGV